MELCGINIIEIIGSEFVSNINSIAGTLVGICAIVVGCVKTSDFFSNFKKKKQNAYFGFYVNMETFIQQMRYLIESNTGAPLATIYYLSPNDELRESGNIPGKNLIIKIEKLSLDFLNYLSTSHEQIPVVNNAEEMDVWNKNYTKLIGYLNMFSSIGVTFVPNLNNDDDINKLIGDIINVFDYFDDLIKVERKRIFEEHTLKKKNKCIGKNKEKVQNA